MGITDYLVRIEELTNTNLKLLKSLNEAFYTNKAHLAVNIDGQGTYVIPSFTSLENKVLTLQDNFENLVNAPVTSEAHFVFDGNSRAIQVLGYEQSPAPLILDTKSNFFHENNNILKDFLTPVPYLKFDMTEVPNDINTVIIRKVSAITDKAKTRFASFLTDDQASASVNWGDIKKVLDYLALDEDYTLYDTDQRLPVRKGQGSGSYVVREIINEEIDQNLDQHLTVKFANNIDGYQKSLTYLLFDQTINRDLAVGDYIVSWDGHAKYQIEELNFNTNVVKMRVCFGDYADLTPYTDQTNTTPIDDISKMRFFSEADLFADEKYVKVPLEEDQYIFVAIAPINDRMNIRASWGDGLVVNTDKLRTDDDTKSFREYYETCRNIGDILNEISKVMGNTTSSHSNDELKDYMLAKPIIDPQILKVTHINKHLDDSPTIQNIRALYTQKNNYNADLTDTQNSITALQTQLDTVDFEDTTGVRASLQNQIDEYTQHKNDLINSLIKITDEIALAANNSVVPIENAKYRIRGFFDFVEFANQLHNDTHSISEGNIKGIYVQYRYRNIQQESGTAQSFVKDVNGNGEEDEGDKTFIFSDWNVFTTPLRPRIRTTSGEYIPYPDTSNMNVPSFNQIDIPITQGETVDVRLKVIYDYGYPFIQMTSDWSDVVTFAFPEEFIKDVTVMDIIEENNSDIETNRFNTILINNGVTSHVNDKLVDQDVTYFHKPENIASGFYTAERRVIPLRDKLKTMDDAITRINDELEGTTEDQLGVSIEWDESSIDVSPFEVGNVILKGYDEFSDEFPASGSKQIGNYTVDSNKIVSISCNIKLTNKSDRSLKIFSMFPGTDNVLLNNLQYYKFPIEDYATPGDPDVDKMYYGGVWLYKNTKLPNRASGSAIRPGEWALQTTNQIITFRLNNLYNGEAYYEDFHDESHTTTPPTYYTDNKLPIRKKYYGLDTNYITLPQSSETTNNKCGMAVYPCITKLNGLLMTYKEAYSYMLLNPGDEIVIPIKVEYKLNGTGDDDISTVQKTISFDIRTSLYSDPLNYTVAIDTKYHTTDTDKMVSSLTKKYQPKSVKTREYKVTVR